MAQNKQLLYDFTEVPQSLLLNPGAAIEHDVFVGMPLLSHVHVNAGSSGVNLYDLFADDGVDFNEKLGRVVYDLRERDNFTLTQQLEVFSAGFSLRNRKDTFISFGMYQETDFHMYHPKDYALLTYEGNANNLNRVYDLSHLNITAELLSVFHVGFHKKMNDRFRFGVRAKLYSSAVNVSATTNKGTFVTTEGEENFYSHQFDLDLEAKTAGLASLVEDDATLRDGVKKVAQRMFLGGDLGFGVDVGVTYEFLDNWTMTASIQDFGAIYHTKDVENYAVKGSYTYNGVNPLFPAYEGVPNNDYWDQVSDEFEELFEVDTTTTKYVTWRPLKMNASVKYTFNKKKWTGDDCDCYDKGKTKVSKTEIGAHVFAVKRPRGLQPALTVYGQKGFFNFLTLRGAYTIDRYSFNNLGLGLSTKIGPVNLYVMGDNLLGYRNLAKANSASLQFGLNFVFDRSD